MKHRLATSIGLLLLATSMSFAGNVSGFLCWWDTDEEGDSPGVGVKGTMPLTDHFEADVRGYWYFDLTGSDLYELESASFTLGPNFIHEFSDTFKGYMGCAVALWWHEQEEGEENEENIVDFGFHALTGLQLKLDDRWELFGEIQYIWADVDLETQGVGTGPEENVSLDGPGFNVGMTYRW